MMTQRSANTVLNELRHNLVLGRMLRCRPRNDYDKVPLTETGQRIVSEAVQICLRHDVAPNCSVNGDDASCELKIISINRLEVCDLIDKLEALNSQDPKRPALVHKTQ